jgi:paraquat-inducible protein B
MSKQANKTVIGLFVVGAIALAVIAIVVLGSGKLFKKTSAAVCYFEGSVGGLNVGAPVVFRGVKIGTVTEVAFRFDLKKVSVTIPVFIELEQRRKGVTKKETIETYKQLIDRGLKAQLEMQSIVTGQLQIALDFYPDKPAKYVKADPDYFEIPTIQSPLQELTKKIEKIPIDEIFQKVLSAVEGIEKVVNSPEIPDTVHSINQAAKEIKPLASNLEETVKDVRKLVQNVDSRIGPLASSIEGTVNDYGKLARDADSKIDTLSLGLGDTIKEIQKAVSSIEKTLVEAQLTLAQARQTLAEDSTLSYEIAETLEELQKGARSIRLLADGLKRQPESVIWGK